MAERASSPVRADPGIRKPDFFILGAPKCGTTTLAQWLAEHPEIYFSPRKEPHFFNTDGAPSTLTLDEYEAYFAGADERHVAVGEGSTHYLASHVAVPQILEYSPDARFVVCLRNPVEMAPALHNECLRQGWEVERSFEAAWHLQARRRAGERVPRMAARTDPGRLQYGRRCRLGEQLERLYGWVERERVLPVLLDDVKQDPGREYRRVLDFLGVSDDGRDSFPVANVSRRLRSVAFAKTIRATILARDALGIRGDWGIANKFRRWNARADANPPLSPEIREELRAYYADDIERLATLLDRDLSHWLA